MIDTAEKAPIKFSFPDYTQFVGKNLTDEYEIIKFLTDTGDKVLDIFAGSNTTGFAAEQLERF